MKKVLLIVACLVVLGAGALLWAINRDNWFPLRDEIAARVTADGIGCEDPKMPLLVTLQNNSSRNVAYVSYSVSVNRAGHSTTLYEEHNGTDEIMTPGKVVQMCIPRPGDNALDAYVREGSQSEDPYRAYPGEIEYSIKVDSANA